MCNALLRPSRSVTLLLLAASLACWSNDQPTAIPPATLGLLVLPNATLIQQGASASVSVKVTLSREPDGEVTVTVTEGLDGVTTTVTSVETTGRVTIATLRIDVGPSMMPGTYQLAVRGSAAGFPESSASLWLTVVEPPPSCAPEALVCAQWAASATASTEYTSTDWSAAQAAGQPSIYRCADEVTAWASAEPDGVDWLELRYPESVRPTEIRIHENWGVSSIVSVEVRDVAGTYHTVYSAQPGRFVCPRTLYVPVTGVTVLVNAVRINVDQRLVRDWNEIDAVLLIGTR
jgi:hypothetical protein